MSRKNKFLATCLSILLLTACGSANKTAPNTNTRPDPIITPIPGTLTSTSIPGQVSLHVTQNDLTGNRVVSGAIDLTNADVLDIFLEGKPSWLVGAVFNGNVILTVVMDDGRTQAFKILEASYEPFDISPDRLPAGMPPVLLISDNTIQSIIPPGNASPFTNPLMLGGEYVYIASNGDLISGDMTSQTRLPINALPDSRILVDEKNRLLVLTQPTTRYDHGVLGDALEASGISLIETKPELRVAQEILIETSDVIEGISAIWADIDNDGTRDIIVTLSNDRSGSRVVAYREDGTLLAESIPIGLGHRWRHQIAVAVFDPKGLSLLADVRTPHIGGIVEFLQYNNGRLEIAGEIKGFSTHSIGSRNLDSAIAGDFNNDGIAELLAPDQSHTNLGIISPAGVIAVLPLDGMLTSNLSAVSLDGKIYIGAGTRDNLRVWIP